MSVAAFCLLAVMITAYILLDGYDLGVAAITPVIARTDAERAASMQCIGPFWNGNEVWLVAAAATLFALFPQAYASAFSGFYLPFIVVLWLLMFRGIAMELRSHFTSDLWHGFWDFCFAASSILLIALFGVALGNIVRGIPLDRNGYFLGTFGFLLNPYALAVALLAILALALHGAAFVRLRITGPPAERCRALSAVLWWLVLAVYVAVSLATVAQHKEFAAQPSRLGLVVFPLLSLAALIAARIFDAHRADTAVFASSCAFLAGLLAAAAYAIFPYILPGYPQARSGLSITGGSPSPAALIVAFTAVVIGLCAVVAYSIFVWRTMARKISL